MSVAKLASIELLKIRKRFGFWMALLFFFRFFLLNLGGGLYAHIRRGVAGTPLPQSWPGIVNLSGGLGMLVVPGSVTQRAPERPSHADAPASRRRCSATRRPARPSGVSALPRRR
jgi:hypothetical protein